MSELTDEDCLPNEDEEITKGRITVKTGRRRTQRSLGTHFDEWIPTVEIWIGGLCFRTDAPSEARAVELVRTTAIELGIKP